MQFLEALDLDPRPTLVFDTDSLRSSGSGLVQPAFCNAALRNEPRLFNATVLGDASGAQSAYQAFRAWICSSVDRQDRGDTSPVSVDFLDLQWLSFDLKGQWVVVSSTSSLLVNSKTYIVEQSNVHTDVSAVQHDVSQGKMARLSANPVHQTILHGRTPPNSRLRHTRIHHSPNAVATRSQSGSKFLATSSTTPPLMGSSTYINFIRNHDWASTALGPMATWPDRLIHICNIIFSSPQGMAVWWGPDLLLIYNEACLPVIADRHPSSLGQRGEDNFAETWDSHYRSIVDSVRETGKGYADCDANLSLLKAGVLEEAFLTTTFLPLFGSEGDVIGELEIFTDATKQNIAQRRTRSLLEINASTAPARNRTEMWSHIVDGLRGSERDIPQLLVYTVEPRDETVSDANASTDRVCTLETSLGYADSGSSASMHRFNLNDESERLASLFRHAAKAEQPLYLCREDAALSEAFWQSLEPRAFGDQTKAIVIVPIRPTSATSMVACLLFGLSPRLKYGDDYREYVQLLQRQISSSIASVILLEEEVFRRQTGAAEAASQIQLRTEEAEAHELRFTRFAENAPIGICTYGLDGSMVYANQKWYSMTGFSKDRDTTGSSWWTDLIFPEDLLEAQTMFGRLLLEKIPVAFEMRIKTLQESAPAINGDVYVWILCSAYPDFSNVGPDSVVACFTDISEQKRIEEIQARRLEDAIEAKRQQENFIDVTSHEIRNPLSVVLQCGEEIISLCTETLKDVPSGIDPVIPLSSLKNALEAAETIEYCTLHQKRIVDDILTLSKMDSGLLPVTPDRAQPLKIVEGILKVFERDMRISGIQLHFDFEDSFRTAELEWAELDSNRFSQIIINLVSNAVKFTKTQKHRKITIKVAATASDKESVRLWSLDYLERRDREKGRSSEFGWAEADTFNLHFGVQDTGQGMSAEEKKVLFTRFSQASPYTHVQYGGSGLGLYICRGLTEMHGGQIGLSSQAGQGSLFGFYIKVRRCQRGLSDMASPSLAYLQPTILATSSNQTASNPSGSETAQVASSKFNIIVVEDNVINQKVLRRQFEKLGHKVLLANHGHEALDLLKTTRYWRGNEGGTELSAMLMDIEMPIMNGIQCTKKIRELQSDGSIIVHIPIIAVTGNARTEKVQLAKAAGMDEVVLKPFSIPTLIPLIERLQQKRNKVEIRRAPVP